ncbi:unnamed protein product, partial [Coccothraustes coccothraustes]
RGETQSSPEESSRVGTAAARLQQGRERRNSAFLGTRADGDGSLRAPAVPVNSPRSKREPGRPPLMPKSERESESCPQPGLLPVPHSRAAKSQGRAAGEGQG